MLGSFLPMRPVRVVLGAAATAHPTISRAAEGVAADAVPASSPASCRVRVRVQR